MKIQKDKVYALLQKLKGGGKRIIAPTKQDDLILFKEINSPDEIIADYINTRLSIKGFFLPRSEPILDFKILQKNVEYATVLEEHIKPTVIFGVRPCDAGSLPIMDKVYTWDYIDEYWVKRREATLIIGVSCLDCDEACFCTSVGLDPGSTKGTDILLTPAGNDTFLVEAVSDKGKKLVEENREFFAEGDADKDSILAPVRQKLGKKFDLSVIQPWLQENFFSKFWEQNTLYCIGCGVCTFVCPTCHCFDIVDEGNAFSGKRMKLWDACQFRMFTIHASGHNPRARQDERHRQRIEHKFNYYPKKFGETLCVGCGRCVRYCPVDLSILRLLSMISQVSQSSTQTSRAE